LIGLMTLEGPAPAEIDMVISLGGAKRLSRGWCAGQFGREGG
jgi:hypothetical protein